MEQEINYNMLEVVCRKVQNARIRAAPYMTSTVKTWDVSFLKGQKPPAADSELLLILVARLGTADVT